MKNNTNHLPISAFVCVCLALTSVSTALAETEVLIDDQFDGTGIVNNDVWRISFADPDGGSDFLGQTLLRSNFTTDFPTQGQASATATDGLVTSIQLDTYNNVADNAGESFLGQELLTRRNYARGGGLTYKARVRFQPPAGESLPGGIVGGVFLYDTVAGIDPPIRDEIDHELLTNEVVAAGADRVYTNVYTDEGFPGVGSPQFTGGALPANFDLTEFHDYEIEWGLNQVVWRVDGQVVRTESTNVPNDPMRPRINIWVPDDGFADGYDASLTPDSTPETNREYRLEIDSVSLTRKNTARGENLLVDPGFEGGSFPVNNFGNLGPGNGWFGFNNVFVVSGNSGNGVDFPTDPDDPTSTKVASTYGPFSGAYDASGFLQQVAVEPGKTYEASIKAITSTLIFNGVGGDGDSIVGYDNFATLDLWYLDAEGDVIAEYSTPLIDGRDPNAIEDRYVTGVIDSIAPAGAVTAEFRGLFVQICDLNAFPQDPCDPGSVQWDSASFVELTVAQSLLIGDANGDGQVDGNDLIAVEENFGATGDDIAGDANGDGQVDGNDLISVEENFGATSGAANVPEPASLALLATGGLAMLRRRKAAA